MFAFKVTTVGSSVGVILPQAARDQLGVGKGDVLYLTPAPGGGFRITPHNPDFARQMEIAEQILREDREIFKALAK